MRYTHHLSSLTSFIDDRSLGASGRSRTSLALCRKAVNSHLQDRGISVEIRSSINIASSLQQSLDVRFVIASELGFDLNGGIFRCEYTRLFFVILERSSR
jgi:hypothetical protein